MKLVLEPTIVMQIIGDEKFYKACPSYFFMKDNGLATHARWQQAVVERRPDCDDCNDKGIYKPVVKTFADHTVRMFKEDPKLLAPLVKYLTNRLRGKKLSPILLYYRNGRATESISF